MVNAIIRGTTVAAQESAGTQTITVASMTHVQPKGARIYATWADAATPTTGRDGARWSDYFIGTDGSTAGTSQQSEHNAATSATDRYAADDGKCVVLLDTAGAVLEFATFGSWVNGGMNISWNGAASDGVILHVEFYFGDQVEVAVGADTGPVLGNTADIITGFMPDHLMTNATVLAFAEAGTTTWHRHVGHYVRLPGLLTFESSTFMQEVGDNKATAECSSISNDSGTITNGFRGGGSIVLGNSTTLDSFLVNGFRISAGGPGPVGASGPAFAWMAIRYGANRSKLVRRTTPTAAGTEHFVTAGFQPWSALAMSMATTAVGNNLTDNSGQIGQGYASPFDSPFSASTNEDDAAATMDNSSRSVAKFMSLRDATDAGFLYECDIASWNGGGVSFSWTNMDGTARRFAVLLLERDQIIGCGHGDLPLLIGEGEGLVGVVGVGAGTLPLLEGEGSGSMFYVGAGDAFLPLLQGAAFGRLLFMERASCMELPPLLGAGLGTLSFIGSGDGDLPLLLGEGLALETFIGAGAGSLPLLDADGVGVETFIGAGAGVLPRPLGEGAAFEVFLGTGAGTLPLLDADGAGLVGVIGSGAGMLPLLIGTGTGTTDVLPFACEVELLGSKDAEVSLQASHDVEADLLGSHDVEVDLLAGHRVVVDLQASYDGEADLLGSCG